MGKGLGALERKPLEPLWISESKAAHRTKLDKLERKQRRRGPGESELDARYELMDELMKCATNIKHLISPMFRCLLESGLEGRLVRYKITQQYLWKAQGIDRVFSVLAGAL